MEPWSLYLSGEIHSNWRERIRTRIERDSISLELWEPVTDHAMSDECGVRILGSETEPFWIDHKAAKLNGIRTRTLLERADVVVAYFGPNYRQWNTAFDVGYAVAKGKPVIVIHDAELTHALKEVDAAAAAVVAEPECVADVLNYVIHGVIRHG